MTDTDHRRRRPVSSFTSVYVYYVTYRCYASLSLTSTATLTSVLNSKRHLQFSVTYCLSTICLLHDSSLFLLQRTILYYCRMIDLYSCRPTYPLCNSMSLPPP